MTRTWRILISASRRLRSRDLLVMIFLRRRVLEFKGMMVLIF